MNIWTIILAAGAASRFGGPKALASWGDGTLLSHAIELAPEKNKVVVVTGAHDIKGEIPAHVHVVHNPTWPEGMGTSIAMGLAYLSSQKAEMALIVPVDQPFVTREHVINLANQAREENRCILTQDGTISGPPAAIPSHLFSNLGGLTDGGLKSVLTDFGLCNGTGISRDIDTPEDLERLMKKY